MDLFSNYLTLSITYTIIFLSSIPLSKSSNLNNISYIIIPFYTKHENESLLSSYYYNDMYSKLKIGSNNQQIEMKLQLNSFPLYLVDKKSVSKNYTPYIQQDSTTYVPYNKSFFFDKDFISGITSKDKFIINSKKVDLRFILVDQMSYSPTIPPGSIGFGPSPSTSNKVKNINFIEQLKGNNIISDYSLSFYFNKNNKKDDFGEIFIGVDLDEIKSDFKNKNKIIIKSGTNERHIDWGFMFKDVELINNNANTNYTKSCFCNDDAILDFSHEFLIATKAFSYSIKKIFFNELIQEKKCQIEEIKNKFYNYNYRIIKCDKNIKEYIIINFPIIKFTIKDFNHLSLNFTHNDLFFTQNDYLYFKIILYNIENENDYQINLDLCQSDRWIFGKLFFKKYNITLNMDKKAIIFYFDNNNKENKKEIIYKNENRINNKNRIIIWILILFLCIFGFILFHFIRKNFLLKKKIYNKNRKNVLINEMEYFPHVDE